MEPISEADRLHDLRANIRRGNHKSAIIDEARVITILQDEVRHMWQLPLPPRAVLELPDIVIAPLGLAHQFGINERGEIVPKARLTHDQSFNVIPGTRRSVNHRTLLHLLTPCRYGHALLRFIHVVLSLRARHPSTPILMTKIDLKAAYRRVHLAAQMALQACVMIGGLLLLALRLTFGGAANPSQWSDISEMAMDLANDLVHHPGWDPSLHSSPHQHLIADRVELEPASTPFATALAVRIPWLPTSDPKCDGYLDDIFMAFLPCDLARGSAVLPLVVHLLGRPVHPAESELREDLLSLSKFIAEATPSETKMILGWKVDSRRLLISLPDDKFRNWSSDIRLLLSEPTVTHKQLEITIGRLNHAGFIIPLARHFLSRLRTALLAAAHRHVTHLRHKHKADLRLWLCFLEWAHRGINLNLLSHRLPTRILRSDACIHGIGGYSLTSGLGWRWAVPPHLRLRATLNTLEFLASYVAIFMELKHSNITPFEVILAQTDSTSAAGWLRKSNFDDDAQPLQLDIARTLAAMVMEHDCALVSQWFPGDQNDLSDSLSRDTDLPAPVLTHLFHSSIPDQVPSNFSICPLPPELCCRLETWLLSLPAPTQSQSAPLRSKLRTGATTLSSFATSTSPTTPSLPPFNPGNASASSEPSPPPTATADSTPNTTHQRALQSCLAQCVPPSTQWLRPSGLTTVSAPPTTQSLQAWRSFYKDN
jgi:hypothetical protein